MTPRNAKPTDDQNPVLSWRVPPEPLRQLDALCKLYRMNRMQVLLMLVANEYGRHEALDQRKEGGDE